MKTPILISALFFAGLISAQEKTNDTLKTTSIKEVMMTKKVFKKESDRFVYDVSNAPMAKGSTTFEVLKQTPLLSSTDDKSLKIAGKNNALIYINGRKSNMDAESLSQFLKNTPAENIQKIEVITVPGSEYQVDSSDGIVNIILKKKSTDGLNGNMRMSNSQNKYNSSSASGSINYRKDKFGLSANVSASESINAQYYILKNGGLSSSSSSEGTVSDPNKDIGGYLNLDYQLNDNSNIALTYNTWTNESSGSKSDLYNTIRSLDTNKNWISSYNRTIGNDNSRSYNNNFNLNYELKTDSLGSKLNLNAAYLIYKRFQNSANNTILSNENGAYGDLMQSIVQSVPQKINNFSGMVDYIKKFNNDLTISVGGNYNNTKTDNDTKNDTYFIIPPEATKSEPNYFVYNENIYGLYFTINKKFSEKFSGKIGTRYEITNSVGTSDNAPANRPDMARVEQNYNNLLPYLSLSYSINDNNNISYAFSSRMRRPSFWELNPVKNILTATNYTQNNPFVKASSYYNQELTYMFKNSYFLVLDYSYLKDAITQVPLQRDIVKDGVTYRQLAYVRTNFGDKQEMSAMLGMQKSFFKQYWSVNLNLGVQHNINNGSLSVDPTTGEVFNTYVNKNKSTSFVIQTSNNIRLDKAKTWFAGVNFMYIDKQQIELGTLDSIASLDLNIKKIWNQWTFAVNATDILRTYVIKINDQQADGSYNYVHNDTYRRGVTFSMVYNFGNQKVKKVRNIESAADSIKSRTK